MSNPDVQVDVIISGKIQEDRAGYLRDRIYEEIGKSIHEECRTLDSAISGKSQYEDTINLMLFKITIVVVIDRRLSQKFLKFITDNALREVLADLGREWAMESIETAMDAVTHSANTAGEAVGRAWDSTLSAIARGLKSAAATIEGEASGKSRT
ncbi:MAG TPA: hypothetical protein VFH06_05270 [Candidatus Saccharimonadales bacterium]|nr:hypothetical protein [Candidatus Saccharimonadales bacterium]